MGQIHFGVGCHLSNASPALSEASESKLLGPGGPAPGTARAVKGRNRARPSHPSHSFRVGPAPGLRHGPARATAWRIRVAGLGGESGGAPRRRTVTGPVCWLHPPQPARRRGFPARACLAGRPEHHHPIPRPGRSQLFGGEGGENRGGVFREEEARKGNIQC